MTTLKARNELTPEEATRRAELEPIIAEGMASFVEVGQALVEISDKRLYRNTHSTFKQYCQEKWQISAAHAYRLAEAAEVVESVKASPIGDKITTESQARELARVPKPKRAGVLEAAVKKAARRGKPLTAASIKEAAEESEVDADEVTQAEIQTAGGTDSDPSRPVFVPKLDKQFNDLAHAARGATDTMFEWIDGAEWDTDAAKDAEKSLRLAAGTVAQLIKQAKRAETKEKEAAKFEAAND